MDDFDIRDYDRWCREVMPELATFEAACKHETRQMAGKKIAKKGQSIGRSITRLESLLQEPLNGGFLVDPQVKRKVKPTDAGKLFLRYCERLRMIRSELLQEMATLQRGSEIRVATTQYAWSAYGRDLEREYRRIRPEGILSTGGNFWEQDRVWHEIETEVLEGRADIGIYSFPPSRRGQFPAELKLMNWIEEEFVLVLPKSLAKLVRRDRLSIRELMTLVPQTPKVLHYRRELGFDRTDIIEDFLRSQGVLPRFEGEWLQGFGSILEIKDQLKREAGISFLPWPTVAEEHEKHQLKAFPLPRMPEAAMRPRVVRIIYRPHNCRGAVNDFLKAAELLGYPRHFPGDA